jgi:hypothetical protein
VALGLADRVEGHKDRPLPEAKQEEMRYAHVLTHYRYAGRARAPVPRLTRDRAASTVPPAAPGPGPDSMPADMVLAGASTVPDSRGRSIQLIEALLDLED